MVSMHRRESAVVSMRRRESAVVSMRGSRGERMHAITGVGGQERSRGITCPSSNACRSAVAVCSTCRVRPTTGVRSPRTASASGESKGLVVIRGHQRSSEVIRGHQRPSEAPIADGCSGTAERERERGREKGTERKPSWTHTRCGGPRHLLREPMPVQVVQRLHGSLRVHVLAHVKVLPRVSVRHQKGGLCLGPGGVHLDLPLPQQRDSGQSLGRQRLCRHPVAWLRHHLLEFSRWRPPRHAAAVGAVGAEGAVDTVLLCWTGERDRRTAIVAPSILRMVLARVVAHAALYWCGGAPSKSPQLPKATRPTFFGTQCCGRQE